MNNRNIVLLFSCFTFCIFIANSIALDTISANQTIRDDNNTTIESTGGIFELGFFSPGTSKNRYVGIWYKNIPGTTVVWVANRETPVYDNSGVFRMDVSGNLVLISASQGVIWSSNSSRSAFNPVAQLLDTGNLVIRYGNDSDNGNWLWQSFDHPGDTILPNMKIGWDLVTGLNRYSTSWKNLNDPSLGNYTSRVNRNGYPQLLVLYGTDIQFRFGPWDGIQFSGLSLAIADITFSLNAVLNKNEIYFSFNLIDSSDAMRLVLSPSGEAQFLRWTNGSKNWEAYLNAVKDDCDHYSFCGAYSICNKTQPGNNICGCLRGYEPKSPEKWKQGDWSDGCALKSQFDCGKTDQFTIYSGLKLPDTNRTWTDSNMNIKDCESKCLNNCSCTAYSNIDVREGGIGCMIWIDDLIDIRNYRTGGLDLHVRITATEAEVKSSSRGKTRGKTISITILAVLILVLGLSMVYIFMKRRMRRKGTIRHHLESNGTIENEGKDLDSPLFDFRVIADATNNFSPRNKLGEGGFGPVYKGILDEGQEIAVKRLSKDSRQGLHEFKNEVSLIAKLQHRNLVKLLGCCIKEGEMMLIYEYMPNKSLDSLIFDSELSTLLDWPKRYNIINGIARGILYLHRDSIVRIIHRDLKASNILLDLEMNPKISDFGTARSFGGSGGTTNTTKVVGTFGYMSPEYALDGIFSEKSDVYSFGVLLLEIVSGKKMKGFYDPDPNLNLLGRAWRLYKDGKPLELISSSIVETYNPLEVVRAIKIGLLCVQPYPEDRPSMSVVVLMLSSEIELPQPKQPGFFTERTLQELDSSSRNYSVSSSSDNLSITYVIPRS